MLLFPQRLHKVLDEGTYESIISWQPHGRSFKVHKREEFVKTVLPHFAKSGRTFASFQRQLNYYGFQRYDLCGPDKGSYHHPHFVRGCFDLCKDYMSRKQSVLDKKKGPNNNLGGSINKGEAETLLISPPSTTANPVRISNPFHEAGATRSQEWNITPHGIYPKSLSFAIDQHRVSSHHYPPTPYSQLHNGRQDNFRLPKLEREYRRHYDQISQERSYPYQYSSTNSYGDHGPSWMCSTHTSPDLKPRYQQKISKGSFSKNGDYCYKEERQDRLENRNEKDIQHDRRDESSFSDHFATDNRFETIQQKENDLFRSSYTPRASGYPGDRQFWNSSSRHVSYDAVNDLIVGKDSDAHSNIDTEEIFVQAFCNDDNLKASALEEDLLQMSFSFP